MAIRQLSFKRLSLLSLLLTAVLLPALAQAQVPDHTPEEEAANNRISTTIEQTSNGTITVDIPDDLLQLILNGAPATVNQGPTRPVKPKVKTTGKMEGYRIQVFSDARNPSTLSARARARGNAIAARFPKYRGQIYTFSSLPNWYTRVGNFRTDTEANAALMELKRAFPAFAGEMRTVKCTVIIR